MQAHDVHKIKKMVGVKDDFETCLSAVMQSIFPGKQLSKEQIESIRAFFLGNGSFVSLPTGHGKSLIYQLAVPLAKKMHELGKHGTTKYPSKVPAHPIILVIAPLNSLICDQIDSCKKKQMRACKLDDLSEGCNCEGKLIDVDFIFTSPEKLLHNLNFLSRIEDQLLCIVVDESHCVINWGTAPNGKSPFCSSYSRVGNVRALVNVPILCLTATACSTTRNSIIKCLNMKNTKVIQLLPDKENIRYIVEKAKNEEIGETLSWLLHDLNLFGGDMDKTVIFCCSIKECGEIYETFLYNLSDAQQSHFAMYHAKTPQRIKDVVLADFLNPDGAIRLVIATSALGMGVNTPNIRRIVNYGIPKDIESYVQGVGRGGRDGGHVMAIMYYKPYHLCHVDKGMRLFVKNQEKCRHSYILEFFGEKINKTSTYSHKCCDICTRSCNCGSCPEEVFKYKCSEIPENDSHGLTRNVTPEERETFIEVLYDLNEENKKCASVLGSSSLGNTIDDAVIKDISDDLKHVFTTDYIIDNFPVFNEQLAYQILSVIQDIFIDINDMDLSYLKHKKLEDIDLYFSNVPEQCSDSDESE